MLIRKRTTRWICSLWKIVFITCLTVLVLIITQNRIPSNDWRFYKQVVSFNNSIFNNSQKTLETKIRCVGSLYNQSCLYQNLYYLSGEFIVLTVKGTSLPVYSVRTNSMDVWPVVIKKRDFDSYVDLERFVRTVIDPMIFPLLTVYFVQEWHYNIGHALFDGLYPAYVALIRFSPRHLQPFRILTELRDCQDCWSEDIYRRFSGLPMIQETVLREVSKRRWFMFDELIMGSGTICQRCTQPNLQLPGGVELDAARLFRDRMYQQHGLFPPTIRRNSSSEHRTSRDILHAYIIHNKRYTDDDLQQIIETINEINNETNSYLSQTMDKTSLLQRPLIHVSYLYYQNVTGHNLNSTRLIDSRSSMYELIENQFIGQLRLLRQMDIHLSAPGNGQMYQTFLSDGSIHINLGGLKSQGEQVFTSFGEQYMTSGTPYIKGLYYPINERPKGIKKNELIKLIRQAARLIRQGFALPVNARENLAVDGHLFIEMCEKDKEFCSLVTTRSPNAKLACFNFWIEELIHEHRQWQVGGIIENNKNISCYYNHTLLHELREKYGIKHGNTDH